MSKDGSVTPMMKQYNEAKEAAQGALLLFRMGDFYEMFGEDAQNAAKTLGLTLTTRDKVNKTPMAGFPWQHLDAYLLRLVNAGFRVAVCDQLENPKRKTDAKTPVQRGVTRIVTPGTLTDEAMLDPKTSNYLASVYISDVKNSQRALKLARRSTIRRLAEQKEEKQTQPVQDGVAFDYNQTQSEIPDDRYVGLAWVELSTGHFCAATITFGDLIDALARINPAECLVQEDMKKFFPQWLLERVTLTERPGWFYSKQTALENLKKFLKAETFEGYGFSADSDDVFALQAAGAAVDYLKETQKQSLDYIDSIVPYRDEQYLAVDESTRRSLEISQSFRDGKRDGSLLDTIDLCLTSMGSRLLADWLAHPLLDIAQIETRQDAVADILACQNNVLEQLREFFKQVFDLERILSRVVQKRATPRELLAIAATLEILPRFKAFLDNSQAALLRTLGAQLVCLEDLAAKLRAAIVPDPPLNFRDGGFIQHDFDEEFGRLANSEAVNRAWVSEYEGRLKKIYNLPNIKVAFTSVFGYYIELPRSTSKDKIPPIFRRTQTLKNAERYATDELEEKQKQILTAQEDAKEMEFKIFDSLMDDIIQRRVYIQSAANILAHLDVLINFATLAKTRNYCRPTLVKEPVLLIREGRHPSLETVLSTGQFVPNDAKCDENARLHLITGPNMSGKSTFIRQTALLVLLAQIGSYIPAREATIGVVDKIFARVGASDEIMRGQSTFMVEMIETARILNNATDRSLVILDEIGRGTSTYDGVSLAWAIAEHIANKIKCRAFFATHYHELTDLEQTCQGVNNLNVGVREWDDGIAFLHKITKGAADKSYGIHVAQLAGVPREVVARAQEILKGLEAAQVTASTNALRKALRDLSSPQRKKSEPAVQFSLFGPDDHPVVQELKDLDLNTLTPMDALLLIERWKKELK
ncbi:MAG: DNA mismatch repair protein MutS [Planctomycetia bacterium]|nr:DNA mismatch repair protein MutS [Planctomycetia bacterium]